MEEKSWIQAFQTAGSCSETYPMGKDSMKTRVKVLQMQAQSCLYASAFYPLHIRIQAHI